MFVVSHPIRPKAEDTVEMGKWLGEKTDYLINGIFNYGSMAMRGCNGRMVEFHFLSLKSHNT